MADGAVPPLGYATFCSGVEGVTLAWDVLGGFEPVFFSEIDPFASAVLAHRWPHVANFGDLTAMDCNWWRGKIPVVWGSCPCQAFSFAGRRRGLNDTRGNLTLAFCDRVEEIEPLYVLYENVKGILSDCTNAFGCLLGALAGEDGPLEPPGGRWSHAGYVLGPKRTIAWRLFDAQHGGVPQRRERVFVVGSAPGGADPRDILFEREGVRRDSAPRREAQAALAAPAAGGAPATGAEGGLRLAFGGNDTRGPIDVAPARNAHGGPHGRLDFESEAFLVHAFDARQQDVCLCGDVTGSVDTDGWSIGAVSVTGDVTHALKAEGADASEDGTGRGNPIIAFGSKDHGADAAWDLSPTLRAMPHDASHPNAGGQIGIAYSALSLALRGREGGGAAELGDEVAGALRTAGGGGGHAFALIVEWAERIQARVRRLTPLECERLQGLPDNHTRIPWRGRPADQCPDGPRYKAIGNGLAIPDVRWIGMRLLRAHTAKIRQKERAA